MPASAPWPPAPEGGSQCKRRRREGDVDRLQGESQACDGSFLTSSPPAGEGGHVPQKGSRVCLEGRGQQGGRQPASRLWGVTATCRGLAGSQAVHLERLEDEPCPLPRTAQPSFLPPRVLHVPERREPSLWGLGAEEGREASFALDLDPEGQGREAVTERNGRPCRDGPQGHAWLEGCVPRRRTSSSRPRSVDTHTYTRHHTDATGARRRGQRRERSSKCRCSEPAGEARPAASAGHLLRQAWPSPEKPALCPVVKGADDRAAPKPGLPPRAGAERAPRRGRRSPTCEVQRVQASPRRPWPLWARGLWDVPGRCHPVTGAQGAPGRLWTQPVRLRPSSPGPRWGAREGPSAPLSSGLCAGPGGRWASGRVAHRPGASSGSGHSPSPPSLPGPLSLPFLCSREGVDGPALPGAGHTAGPLAGKQEEKPQGRRRRRPRPVKAERMRLSPRPARPAGEQKGGGLCAHAGQRQSPGSGQKAPSPGRLRGRVALELAGGRWPR